MSYEAHATNTISTNSGTPPVGPLGLWVFGSLGLWEWMQPQRHNDTTDVTAPETQRHKDHKGSSFVFRKSSFVGSFRRTPANRPYGWLEQGGPGGTPALHFVAVAVGKAPN